LGKYRLFLAMIMKEPVSDGEMEERWAERVWLTVIVTSGRIIIGWRVGT
jgi:hypothetical protein